MWHHFVGNLPFLLSSPNLLYERTIYVHAMLLIPADICHAHAKLREPEQPQSGRQERAPNVHDHGNECDDKWQQRPNNR
jgi:hypothetical protein